MADVIKDGTGSGKMAQVDSKNRLRCYAVYEDEATYINRVEGEMYSGMLGGSLTGTNSDSVICYLKNTHTSKDMIIKKIKHRCTAANGTLSFWLSMSGTPGGSLTTVTPTNRNANSNNSASAEMYKSSDITGLTGGRKVGSIYGVSGAKFEYAEPCSGYIIPPNGTFTMKCNNNTAAHWGGVSFYYRDV